MSEATEIMTATDAGMLENVLVNGDLSKLSPAQRLDYYRQVCQSMGLNPLSRPFDYITLNGRLTLYAKKDATDQLRNINGVSIDDVNIQEDESGFTVIVKGRNAQGRSDIEIGCVSKRDMGGNIQNLKMKAVTKAKRRLTLSLCGLGWLDETEIETIPNAKPVVVDTATGEILDAPKPEKPAEKQPKKPFDEAEFLSGYRKPDGVADMTSDAAATYTTSDGRPYTDLTTKELVGHWIGLSKRIKGENEAEAELTAMNISAICRILFDRKMAAIPVPNGGRPDPHVSGS